MKFSSQLMITVAGSLLLGGVTTFFLSNGSKSNPQPKPAEIVGIPKPAMQQEQAQVLLKDREFKPASPKSVGQHGSPQNSGFKPLSPKPVGELDSPQHRGFNPASPKPVGQLEGPAPVWVNGYHRKDGTFVPGHYRSRADGDPSNNWSVYPNVNPYTGKQGSHHQKGDLTIEPFPKQAAAPTVQVSVKRRIKAIEFVWEYVILDDRSIWKMHPEDWRMFRENDHVFVGTQSPDSVYDRFLVSAATNYFPAKARVKFIGQGTAEPKFRGEDFYIRSTDGAYLGTLSQDSLDQKSILNPLGVYGYEGNPASIFNSFGKYGGVLSNYSPFNENASEPPMLCTGDKAVLYLTMNSAKTPAIDAKALIMYLKACN